MEMQRAIRASKVTHFFAVPLVWDTVVARLKAQIAASGETARFEKGVEKSIALQKMFPRFGQWVAKRVLFKQITDKLFGRSLVLGISGGAYCSGDTLKIINALGYNLLNGYGSTEAAIVSVNTSPNIRDRMKPNCGKIFRSVSYEVDQETGELILAGDTLYYAKMQAGELLPRGDALVRTRDVASIDEEENLTLLGRLDEIMIGPNGENLSPDVIEGHYRTLGTDDYCVLVCEAKLTLAVNRTTLPTGVDLRAVIAEANKTVPLVERVQEVRLVDYPCRTAIGKANRRALLEGFRSGTVAYASLREEERNQSTDPDAEVARQAVAAVLHIAPKDIDDYDDFFINLGGNSLQYFELMSQVSAEHKIQVSYAETLPTTVASMAERLRESRKGESR